MHRVDRGAGLLRDCIIDLEILAAKAEPQVGSGCRYRGCCEWSWPPLPLHLVEIQRGRGDASEGRMRSLCGRRFPQSRLRRSISFDVYIVLNRS